MEYTEIIDRAAKDNASETDYVLPKYFQDCDELLANAFKAGTEYYKQITEIEVASGKIELLKSLMIYLHSLPYNKKLADLEQLRDKLINELNK